MGRKGHDRSRLGRCRIVFSARYCVDTFATHTVRLQHPKCSKQALKLQKDCFVVFHDSVVDRKLDRRRVLGTTLATGAAGDGFRGSVLLGDSVTFLYESDE